MKYDIVKQINTENERKLMAPFYWAVFFLTIGIVGLIKLILVFADIIDASFIWLQRNHPVPFGLVLVFGSLFLLIRREIKRV